MSGETVNPNSSLALTQAMQEELRAANNLADLPNRVTALANLGVTGSATTVTVTSAAAGANDSTITVTVKDANGSTVAGVYVLDLYFSGVATGIGLTSTAYSGTLVASTGAILTTLTAKKHFRVVTAATGIFAGTLTDTSKTADYAVAQRPLSNGIVVSSAMAFG